MWQEQRYGDADWLIPGRWAAQSASGAGGGLRPARRGRGLSAALRADTPQRRSAVPDCTSFLTLAAQGYAISGAAQFAKTRIARVSKRTGSPSSAAAPAATPVKDRHEIVRAHRGATPQSGSSSKKYMPMVSATQAGFFSPSTSMRTSDVRCIAPARRRACRIVALPRTRLPTGTIV